MTAEQQEIFENSELYKNIIKMTEEDKRLFTIRVWTSLFPNADFNGVLWKDTTSYPET